MALNRRYVPDLKKMAAACEGNYLRLNKLMPDFELGYEKTFLISSDLNAESKDNQAQISLKVTVMVTVAVIMMATRIIRISSRTKERKLQSV